MGTLVKTVPIAPIAMEECAPSVSTKQGPSKKSKFQKSRVFYNCRNSNAQSCLGQTSVAVSGFSNAAESHYVNPFRGKSPHDNSTDTHGGAVPKVDCTCLWRNRSTVRNSDSERHGHNSHSVSRGIKSSSVARSISGPKNGRNRRIKNKATSKFRNRNRTDDENGASTSRGPADEGATTGFSNITSRSHFLHSHYGSRRDTAVCGSSADTNAIVDWGDNVCDTADPTSYAGVIKKVAEHPSSGSCFPSWTNDRPANRLYGFMDRPNNLNSPSICDQAARWQSVSNSLVLCKSSSSTNLGIGTGPRLRGGGGGGWNVSMAGITAKPSTGSFTNTLTNAALSNSNSNPHASVSSTTIESNCSSACEKNKFHPTFRYRGITSITTSDRSRRLSSAGKANRPDRSDQRNGAPGIIAAAPPAADINVGHSGTLGGSGIKLIIKPSRRQTPLTCSGHTRPVVDLSFSGIGPRGFFMMSACKDGRPMLREGTTGDWVGTFNGHKGAVWGVAMNGTASLAASGAADFTAKIWNAMSGVELQSFQHSHIVKTVDFDSGSGYLLTAGNERLLRIFNLHRPNWMQPETFAGHGGTVKRAIFCRDERCIMSAAEDKTVRLWDRCSGYEVHRLQLAHNPNSLEISPDGRILTITHGASVSFWELDSLRKIKEIKAPTNVSAASLHPDRSFFVCGGEDFKIYKYNYETGAEIEGLMAHFGPVHAISFSPDGELFASGSEDGTLRLWQTTVGKTYGLWQPNHTNGGKIVQKMPRAGRID